MTSTQTSELHEAFGRAINTHDVDALVDLYAPDGVAVQLDGSTATGTEAMISMCEGLVGAIRRIDATTRKYFVAGDIALSSASWTAEIVLPDGSVITQQGTTAEVSHRQPDGTWKFVIDDPMFV